VLGGYEIYKCTVPILQKKLKVDIKHVNIKIQHIDTALDILNKGLGDLTWETNAKNLSVDKSDRFYYSSEYNYIYMQKYKDINIDLNFFNYKFDMISVNSDTIIDWNFISNTIISCEPQDSKKTVIILYDSTLLGVLGLWIRTFAESQISAYFIKNTFDRKIIDLIKYDYLVEFRCERFLR
jgi:hypothetical protein